MVRTKKTARMSIGAVLPRPVSEIDKALEEIQDAENTFADEIMYAIEDIDAVIQKYRNITDKDVRDYIRNLDKKVKKTADIVKSILP